MAIHGSRNSSLESAREHVADRLTGVEESHAFRQLGRRIPMHEECHHARPGATFESAQEDADDVDLLRAGSHRHEARLEEREGEEEERMSEIDATIYISACCYAGGRTHHGSPRHLQTGQPE